MKFACRRQNVVLQQREMKRLILEAVSVRPALVTQTGRETENVSFRQLHRRSAAFYRLRVSDRKLESLVSLKDIHRVNIGPWTGLATDLRCQYPLCWSSVESWNFPIRAP